MVKNMVGTFIVLVLIYFLVKMFVSDSEIKKGNYDESSWSLKAIIIVVSFVLIILILGLKENI